MLNFVKRAFRDFFEVLLWINMIGSAIGGGVLGWMFGNDGWAFVGVFIGAIIGILTNIIGGGLVATFLSMDEKLGLLAVPVKESMKNGVEQRIEKISGYFTDSRDGQKYRTVKIGGKTWMAQNLNYQPQTGNYWCYGDDNSNDSKYGRLYDWDTAKSVCPAGWHLPSREEWNDLVTAAGGGVAGKALKSVAGWEDHGNGTDSLGFSALPGGYRNYRDGSFRSVGSYGYWWIATDGVGESYGRFMGSGYSGVGESTYVKREGFSVRCVQD